MKKIKIFTDGACSRNPGPGGWGAILEYNSYTKKISGAESETTNNRMELTALIKSLEMLKEPCDITICTDSKYLCDGITKGWAKKWKINGWKKSDNKPALNADLWEKLLNLLSSHKSNFVWVKGHNGHPENEICDKMATDAIKNLKHTT